MKLGYPCINWTIGCKGDRTFRLKSYSEERLIDTVQNNLDCLLQMLRFNVAHNLLFFRITSDLIPFASHPICTFDWQKHFRKHFKRIGEFIRENNVRISMHPDQFIVLNSLKDDIVDRAIAELHYHAEVLDLMHLDTTAKIQLHVGGVYNDKEQSIHRFTERYKDLNKGIRRRLVVENDDVSYSPKDCLMLHDTCGVPILFDYYHFQIRNDNEPFPAVLEPVFSTWNSDDGVPLVDYSSTRLGERVGAHAEHIDINDFKKFIEQSKPNDFDIMLEIKDKESSALIAKEFLRYDSRFIKSNTIS